MEEKAMKTIGFLFCLVMMTYADSALAGIPPGVSFSEKTFETAIFAAPCPDDSGLWCVAIMVENVQKSELAYAFKKTSNGEIEFTGWGKIPRIEKVKAVFPGGFIKKWGITPAEAILAVYNNQTLPVKKTVKYDWIWRRGQTEWLTATRSIPGGVLIAEKTKPINDLNGDFFVLLVMGLFLGVLYSFISHRSAKILVTAFCVVLMAWVAYVAYGQSAWPTMILVAVLSPPTGFLSATAIRHYFL